MNGESVRLGLLKEIQDGGRVGSIRGPREVKCLDVSAEWREVGRVGGQKLGVGDLQRLAEIRASAINPCPGCKRYL